MKLKHLAFGLTAAGVATLTYGMLVESKKLVLERRTLALPNWPDRLNGFTLAVLADLHIRDEYSVEVAERAIAMALDASPDMVVLPGDIVAYWKPEAAALAGKVLEPLLLMQGSVIATPGNREYWDGTPELLRPILDELNIKYLRNQAWTHQGIQWVGIDSVNMRAADPFHAMAEATGDDPIVALWHEPDLVEWLPSGASLMISGHTHGGQFRLPNGWAPKHTRNGRKYVDGFFPDAPTPLYVSRGVGTTGPPSRLFCPPEVSLLTLVPA